MSVAALARLAWSDGSGAAGAALRSALLPASALFRVASRTHHKLYDAGLRSSARAPIPVISIGNLRVGGAGKTPFAGWVVDHLLEAGRRPGLLHGGYGSDEPELHRRWHPEVPVLVGRERTASARAAAEQGCDVVVLDDGFQHRRLARDLDIVLLAAEHGADNVRLLPRGPWREPLAALRRAGVVVVTRKTASREQADAVVAKVRDIMERRAVHAWLRPAGWRTLDGLTASAPATPAVSLSSIAEPHSFERTLEELGASLAARLAFPDHHDYGAADVKSIRIAAGGRPILTTAKDAVKLQGLLHDEDVRVLEQEVIIEEGESELVTRIAAAMERR